MGVKYIIVPNAGSTSPGGQIFWPIKGITMERGRTRVWTAGNVFQEKTDSSHTREFTPERSLLVVSYVGNVTPGTSRLLNTRRVTLARSHSHALNVAKVLSMRPLFSITTEHTWSSRFHVPSAKAASSRNPSLRDTSSATPLEPHSPVLSVESYLRSSPISKNTKRVTAARSSFLVSNVGNLSPDSSPISKVTRAKGHFPVQIAISILHANPYW